MLVNYSIRNMTQAWRSLLWVACAVAITVSATVASLAMFDGLWRNYHSHKREDVAVVIEPQLIFDSGMIDLDIVHLLGGAAGVATIDGKTQVFPETLQNVRLRSADPDDNGIRRVRALDPAAWVVHEGVRLSEGRMPNTGERAVAIGRQVVGRAIGLELGGHVRINNFDWDVVGIFDATNTPYDSEIFADRSALLAIYPNPKPSTVYVVLTSAGALPSLRNEVKAASKGRFDVLSVPQFQDNTMVRGGGRGLLLAGVAGVTALLVAAVVACLNAMYAQLIARRRELATLLAIGFTRRRVIGMLVFESALLCVVASAIGIVVVTLVFHGRAIENIPLGIIYHAEVTSRVLLAGLAATALITALSSLAAWLPVRRMDILASVRD